MAEKGWLSRTEGQATRPQSGRGHVDVYACSVTRGALLAATITEASERLGADKHDRNEALAALLGGCDQAVMRCWHDSDCV